MNSSIQDSTLSDAIMTGCDTVQPKFKGMWTENIIGEPRFNVSTIRTYDIFNESPRWIDLPSGKIVPSVTLIGNLFFGPAWVDTPFNGLTYIYDCSSFDGHDLTNRPYKDRYSIAVLAIRQIQEPSFRLVKNFPITQSKDLWSAIDQSMCGIVFRRSGDPLKAPVYCQRYYQESPKELI